jgi:arginase family enzyme
MPLHQDPNWPRAGAWLRGYFNRNPGLGRLSVIGAPLSRGSITPGRCDLAPQVVRHALNGLSPYDVETGRDLCELNLSDLGDLPIAELSPEQAFVTLRDGVARALQQSDTVIILGGDNSITRPACRALGDDCSLMTFDAHFDLRDLAGGLSNGNPIRALLRDGMPGSRIVQIGIQSFANSQPYAAVAAQAGIKVITADEVHTAGIEAAVARGLQSLPPGRIYIDLDLDVLDRAYAPASPGSRPGGLAPWQVRRAARMCGADPRVAAIDLVEVDPEKDIFGMTAIAAATCLLSFATGVHQRCSPSRDVRNS